MTLEQVITNIKDIPSLVDAVEVDELIDHVSGCLQDKEEALALVDQQVSRNAEEKELYLTFEVVILDWA